MWGSAVYSGHHYVIDVAGGILCATLGTAIMEAAFRRSAGVRRAVDALIGALRR
jgi:membrane-associated phospholipid phosphatase